MKKKIFIVATIASILVSLTACKKQVDPIHGTEPVNMTFADNFPLQEFKQFGDQGDTLAQKALVEQYRNQLTANVLKNYPCVKEENINFLLGSGFAKDVKSGDGKTYSGKFKNELIIIINDPCKTDTLFLACGNGMLSPLRLNHQSDWGTGKQCRFIIKKGEGLAHYLPQLEEWATIAGELQIPIKNSKGEIVSNETYRTYLDKRYQGILFEGDLIDLCAGKIYNKAGQEVDFERRIEETKKANEKLAKKKSSKKRK